MRKSLRERYEERAEEQVLAEGFMDYFKKGSTNIETFNSTIAQLKAIPGIAKLPSLQRAISSAEQQFQSIVMAQQGIPGEKVDVGKATMISKVTALVTGITNFISSLKNISSQLPTMKQALGDPASAGKPLSQAMTQGQNAQAGGAPIEGGAGVADQFAKLLEKQLNTSGGGIFAKLKGFFKGSGTQTPLQVFKEFGLETGQLAQEILSMNPQEFSAFTGAGAFVKPMQLAEPQGGVKPDGAVAGPGQAAGQQGAAGSQGQPAASATVHPQAFDYMKANISKLPAEQKAELLTLLQGGTPSNAKPPKQPVAPVPATPAPGQGPITGQAPVNVR